MFEQAMTLVPNDVETCFLALSYHRESSDPLFELTLTALGRLFERAKRQGQLPKSKDLGLCEAHAKRPLHKLNSFLQ